MEHRKHISKYNHQEYEHVDEGNSFFRGQMNDVRGPLHNCFENNSGNQSYINLRVDERSEAGPRFRSTHQDRPSGRSRKRHVEHVQEHEIKLDASPKRHYHSGPYVTACFVQPIKPASSRATRSLSETARRTRAGRQNKTGCNSQEARP